jgi:hypothetical protein
MSNIVGNPQTFIQENTTLTKYRIAKHGTADLEVVADVNGSALPVGITDESADGVAGNPVGVRTFGVAKCTILAATTKGAAIKGTTAGKGAANTTQNVFCVGWLQETTTVANQVARVFVAPFLYPTVS